MDLTPEHTRIISNLQDKHQGGVSIHSAEVMSLINILTTTCPSWKKSARDIATESIMAALSEEFPGGEFENDGDCGVWLDNSGSVLCLGSGDLVFSFDEQDAAYIRRFMTAAYEGLDNAKRVEIK